MLLPLKTFMDKKWDQMSLASIYGIIHGIQRLVDFSKSFLEKGVVQKSKSISYAF
jgi:hypothetical protein